MVLIRRQSLGSLYSIVTKVTITTLQNLLYSSTLPNIPSIKNYSYNRRTFSMDQCFTTKDHLAKEKLLGK